MSDDDQETTIMLVTGLAVTYLIGVAACGSLTGCATVADPSRPSAALFPSPQKQKGEEFREKPWSVVGTNQTQGRGSDQ